MKAYKYITLAAAALILVACNKDSELSTFASDPNAVHIQATIGTLQQSTWRKPASNPTGDETTATQFNAGDRIYVSSGSQSAVYGFDGANWTSVIPGQYLIWNTASLTFSAYYPETYRGSGNVPQEQHTDKLIAAADYMKCENWVWDKSIGPVEFAMQRQTARIVIRGDITWGTQYVKNNKSTHKIDSIRINCVGVSDIKPYTLNGNYYALLNPAEEDPDATFITITISPIDGVGAPTDLIVKGIPALEAGYSYECHLTLGKAVASLGSVTVEDWSDGGILGDEENMSEEVK